MTTPNTEFKGKTMDLDSYYVDNTKEIYNKVLKLGYTIEEGHYSDLEYYKKYPFLVLHNGHIQFCHTRHLDNPLLYGNNRKALYICGKFLLPLTD